jgi:hypothetical protein
MRIRFSTVDLRPILPHPLLYTDNQLEKFADLSRESERSVVAVDALLDAVLGGGAICCLCRVNVETPGRRSPTAAVNRRSTLQNAKLHHYLL